MSRSPLECLRHIVEETEYLMSQTQGLEQEQFLRDPTLKRAFVRSIEIIGEATKQIPDEFKSRYSQVEWRAMAGMRDKLIHGYFGIDYQIVWDVAARKAPALHRAIQRILDEEGQRP